VTFAEGSSLVEIGQCAFVGCGKLAEVKIPPSVARIGDQAFLHCAGLSSLTFADGRQLEDIGFSSFQGCKGLAKVKIPASVGVIGPGAFSGCSSLKHVKFAAGSRLTRVGESALPAIPGLTVTAPSDIKAILDPIMSSGMLLKTLQYFRF
jgi:hypothetical protein